MKIRANDYDCEVSGVIKAISPYNYLSGEMDGKIRIMDIVQKPRNDDEKFRVFQRGRFHTHTQINSIIQGQMKKQQDKIEGFPELDPSALENDTYLFATSCGQIGQIQSIPKDTFYWLDYLEMIMSKEIKCLGDFDQLSFRMNDPKDDPYEKLELLNSHKLAKRFIDGDFLEVFESYNEDKKQSLIDKVNTYQTCEMTNYKVLTVDWIESIIKALKSI